MDERIYYFAGGRTGQWAVERQTAVAGPPIPVVTHLHIIGVDGLHVAAPAGAEWTLRGARSNERYVTRGEHDRLVAVQAGLGRPEATLGALIPIRKTAGWWALAQDERRTIFEERSRHVAATMKYLPAIARRLHHGRDLGEPFDFLTWFEYAPEHEAAFDELVAMLRRTEEWNYVDREIDIRVRRL